MRWKWKKLLIKIAIGILAAMILAGGTWNIATKHSNNEQSKIVQKYKIGKYESQMINEKTLYGAIDSAPKVLPYTQPFKDISKDKNDNWLGERQTRFIVNGTYSSPFKLKDVKIKYIDQEHGIVYATYPKTKIDVTIQHKGVSSEKIHGNLRREMNEDEKKIYIIHKEKELEARYNKDENVLKEADLYKQNAIKIMWMNIPNVKSIVFE